jgi:ADP-heptose:LPS heptosyltransferase
VRNVPLSALRPILNIRDTRFYSLQLGPEAEQITAAGAEKTIIDHTQQIADFADTAALMMELDLIISVDTAVAHLAGALGKPVWTLLPFVPDWRWGLDSETTPWYPIMRLFRQPKLGDWDSVIQRVADELKSLAESRHF